MSNGNAKKLEEITPGTICIIKCASFWPLWLHIYTYIVILCIYLPRWHNSLSIWDICQRTKCVPSSRHLVYRDLGNPTTNGSHLYSSVVVRFKLGHSEIVVVACPNEWDYNQPAIWVDAPSFPMIDLVWFHNSHVASYLIKYTYYLSI